MVGWPCCEIAGNVLVWRLNSNKGTKCDIEICDSRALFGEFKCAASESCTPPASLPREFLQAEKEDQEMEEACKRLIKNCIICWNYVFWLRTTTNWIRISLLDYCRV